MNVVRSLAPSLLVATSALVICLLIGGCSNKQVRIEMRTGGSGPVRTFETNRASGEERSRLTEVYDTALVERGSVLCTEHRRQAIDVVRSMVPRCKFSSGPNGVVQAHSTVFVCSHSRRAGPCCSTNASAVMSDFISL